MGKAEKTSKAKTKKSKIGCIGFLVVVSLMVFAVNIVVSYGKRLDTTIVRSGTDEEVVSAEGYIFRKQTLMYAPTDGYLACEVKEDERVSVGETVMFIYKDSINPAVNNQLKEIEQKISHLSEGIRTADIFSSDTAKIEQTISQSLKGIPKAVAKGELSQVRDICDTVNELIEKRRVILGEVETVESDKELQQLKQKKAELEKQYNIQRTNIHAPSTGAFTARIDGMEELLSLEALENINNDYIKELKRKKIEAKTPETVKAGEVVGKIIENFSWSIAAQIQKEETEGLSQGMTIKMRFPDIGAEEITGTVSKIVTDDSSKAIIVVSTNKYFDSVYSSSKVQVEFIKDHFSGFKIPAKSLRMTDGVMGVYVIRSNKARFVPVELLYNGKDWVVVKEKTETAETPKVLKLYDELIINGKNIYDGKVVR